MQAAKNKREAELAEKISGKYDSIVKSMAFPFKGLDPELPDFFLDMAKTALLSYAPKVQEWGDCRDIYMKIKDGNFEELTVLQFGALLSIIDTLKPMDFFIEGSKEAALNAYVKIKDEVYRLRVVSVSISQSIMTEVQKEFDIEPPKQKAK